MSFKNFDNKKKTELFFLDSVAKTKDKIYKYKNINAIRAINGKTVILRFTYS